MSRPASRAAQWRRSSHSTGMNNCVEAAALSPGLLAVRDSKWAGGPALLLPSTAWCPFVATLRGNCGGTSSETSGGTVSGSFGGG
ncbi:DUF397 domain-containing protein [Streptomyces thioluteus]|uniref:DUF397 domain-containing protein n=1 Tax=Streptomyces thioluteus TaxID=66431 RepID=UPI0031EFB233